MSLVHCVFEKKEKENGPGFPFHDNRISALHWQNVKNKRRTIQLQK